MALSANTTIDVKLRGTDGITLTFGVIGSDIIYKGALVAIDGDGYAKPLELGDTFFGGIALENIDNSSGSSGDVTIDILVGATIVHAVTKGADLPVTISDIGSPVYGDSDNGLDINQWSSDVPVGWLINVPVAGTGIVRCAWIGQPIV